MWIKMASMSSEWLCRKRSAPHITKNKIPRENISTYSPVNMETFCFS